MRIRVASTAAEMDGFRAAWDHLYEHSPAATLFQTFVWNRLAADRFGNREWPYVVLAESDSSLAILPAAITSRGLSLLGERLFDYRDLLRAGSEQALWAAWQHLAQLRLPFSVTGLRCTQRGEPWSALEPRHFVNAPRVLRNDLSAEAFAGSHSRMGRTVRLLVRKGVELRSYSGARSEVVGWLYREKANQLAGSPDNLFSDSTRRDFMVSACALDSICEVFTFEAAGEAIAALLTFRDRQTRRFYTVWFNSRWASLSPGNALLYLVTKDSLSAGLDCDYMTGEQAYKKRFATSAAPLYRVWIDPDRLAEVAGTEARQAA